MPFYYSILIKIKLPDQINEVEVSLHFTQITDDVIASAQALGTVISITQRKVGVIVDHDAEAKGLNMQVTGRIK